MIHIFLVDDHKILRKGLKIVLESERNLKVVGEANSVREAITAISSAENIDVVITGINLPNESGLELIKYLYSLDAFTLVSTLLFKDCKIAF